MQKAITGNYTFDRYHDRSMMNIGNRHNVSAVEPLQVEDAELVKTKLDIAMAHHRPSLRQTDRSGSALGMI
jgi:hypothetical protein